jgi:hypothetical protein
MFVAEASRGGMAPAAVAEVRFWCFERYIGATKPD